MAKASGPKKGQGAAAKSTKGGAAAGKGKRVQAQPPGMPQGVHDQKNAAACNCGRCTNKRLGVGK
jgi:hypothetical protein